MISSAVGDCGSDIYGGGADTVADENKEKVCFMRGDEKERLSGRTGKCYVFLERT